MGASERGQASAEYVALLALVALALLAATVVVADPGVGRSVLDGMRRALCEVSGLGCPADAARQPCVVASRRDRDSASVSIVVVRLGADATVLRELRSDGTVAVTLLGAGSAGAEIGLGGGLEAGRGRGGLALGGELRASAIAGLGGGRTWMVPDGRAADRLIDGLGQRRRPLVDGPLGLVRELAGDAPDVRDPDVTFTEGRTGRGATGSLGRGRAWGELELELDDVAGMRTDGRTGLRTLYVRAERSSTAALESKLFGAGAAGGAGELALGVTLDRGDDPVALSLTAARELDGVLDLPPPLRRLAGGQGLQGARRVELDARLDLRDPGNAAAGRRFLAALRRPDRIGELLGASSALGDRLMSFSDLQARAYRVRGSTTGAEGRVRAGGGLGAGLWRERSEALLTGAWERPPGAAWRERLDCEMAGA